MLILIMKKLDYGDAKPSQPNPDDVNTNYKSFTYPYDIMKDVMVKIKDWLI